jgi:hypothetical protein
LTLISNVTDRTAISWKLIRYCSAGLWLLLNPFAAFSQSTIAVTDSVQARTDSVGLAKNTVAPIVCLVRDAATGAQMTRFQIIGTAFMIDKKGTFVTASHVIGAVLTSPSKEVCLPAITFPLGGWKRDPQKNVAWFSFNSGACQVNATFDVAVCRTADDMASKHTEISFDAATISTDRPPDGTSVFFTGFPLQATDPITSIGAVAGYSAGDSYSTVFIDKNAWPGASGSPIYLLDGKTVIGMITRTGTGDSAGLSFGIAGERIVTVLADARTNWEKEQQKASEIPTSPTTQH